MTTARGGVGSRVGLPVLLGVILLWTVVPLGWMVLSSLKPPDELTASTPSLIFTPTFEHYEALFSGGNNIGPYIRNSLVAAGISTISRWCSGAWPATASPEAASAARTMSRSGSSPSGWRRSPRSSCRCS